MRYRQKIGAFYRNRNWPILYGLKLLKSVQRPHERILVFQRFLWKNAIISYLKLSATGIPASVVHLRIDHNSVFGGVRDELQGQAYFNERQVALPVHEFLSQENLECIVRTIKEGW